VSFRVIQAGAGTGKTHRLVTLCLQLFAEGVAPARLCAVTFTEKAAAELKGRIRRRVDALLHGGVEEEVPPRDAAHWQLVRRDLGLAQVGTIHALCAQILRRHAALAGLDPRFSVLDEAQARRTLADACERAVLEALASEDQRGLRLCSEMGLRTQGRFSAGLLDELVSLLSALGESGRDPRELVEETEGLRPEVGRRDDQRARERLFQAVAELAKKVPLESLGDLDFTPGALHTVWPRLRRIRAQIPAARGGMKEVAEEARNAFDALLDADAGIRGATLARDLAALASRARELHEAAKLRAGALDFDDLTRIARKLLMSDPGVRAAEQARLEALLVDEMQDTSRAQLDLLEHLAPAGELTVVGDRKQSIYEFRGADVAAAQEFARKLQARGAVREVLQTSRRSRPALVRFANLLFKKALAADEHPFDTPFGDDDELTAVREERGGAAELIDVSGAGIEAEAEAVGRRLSALLASGIRGGEVAILLRRMTNVDAFRRVLLRRRIPHLVHKGRGFLAAREILDAMALLDAAIDPDDGLALSAVLRSPFGPVSDDALVLLAQRHRLGRRTLLEPPPPELAPDDAEALRRTSALLLAMNREVDRVGPASLLDAALTDSDYLAACAGGLYGEQAAANLNERLLGLARSAEQRGESVRTFAGRLRTLADEEARESEAAVAEEHDPHAVRIMTIHAAKGLEFPVVFVPECAAWSAVQGAERVPLDPDLGLAVKVAGADGKRRFGSHGAAVRSRRCQRELSQSRRLFYVAVTRARDRLVLSGRVPRGSQQECFRLWIDAVREEAVAEGLLEVLPDGGPDVPAPAALSAAVDPAAVADASLADVAGVIGRALVRGVASAEPASMGGAQLPDVARVEAPVPFAQPSVAAPVTQLADAAACPLRYHLLHEVRLVEHPDRDADLPDPLGAEGAAPTALGSLAHRLLELIPLGAQDARSELERLLAEEGEDPATHAEVLNAAAAFLDSPLGKRMAAAKAGRLKRELPFVLRMAREGAPELLMRGQIDALLLDGDAATVVDYKLSKARPIERYKAQLDAYALAARELTSGAVPVRTGIVFLRSPGAPFVERPPPDAATLSAIRESLLDAGWDIAHGRATGEWKKIERAGCERLECGFIRRCHPDSSAAG
jgi:ATP-dependent exoDNAse (exonuclease V) beta subunit